MCAWVYVCMYLLIAQACKSFKVKIKVFLICGKKHQKIFLSIKDKDRAKRYFLIYIQNFRKAEYDTSKFGND